MAQRQFRSDDTDKWIYGFGDGSDGAYNSAGNATDAPIDSSCSGTAGTTSLSATNASFTAGQLILIHQSRGTGVGNWELNRIKSYVSGTITTSKDLINTYTDSGASQAQVLVMKQYSSFTQGSGHTLTAKAWNKNVGGIVAFFCSGTTTITGTITLTGKGFVGGTGSTTINQTKTGEGTSGDEVVGQRTANGNGGGAGINKDGAGGGGGHASSGSNGQGGSYGSGGNAVGDADLSPTMFFGGGGGAAQGNTLTSSGGYGGGILLIITKDLVVTGTIVNGGGKGQDIDPNSNFSGGGGAGGSILLKVKNTASLGENKISAPYGAYGTAYYKGGNGSVGRINLDYGSSYEGSVTNPNINIRQDTSLLNSAGCLYYQQI